MVIILISVFFLFGLKKPEEPPQQAKAVEGELVIKRTGGQTPLGEGESMGANLLFNGGAEDGNTGWTSRDFGVDTNGGSGAAESHDPFSGANNFLAQQDGGMNQPVALIPGATYTLSARVRVHYVNTPGDAGNGYLVVGTTTTGREIVDKSCSPNTYDVSPNVNKWVLCATTFTATAATDAKTVTVYVGFRSASNTHTADFDNLTLVKGDSVASYSPITTSLGSGGSAVGLSGNVGIGTVSPGYKLEVAGGSLALTGSSGDLLVSANDTSPSNLATITSEVGGLSLRLKARGGDNPDLVVATTGNVGIGTASPGQKLDVAGNVQASVYYDRDGTSYYADPAGTSVMNKVNLGGGSWSAVGTYSSQYPAKIVYSYVVSDATQGNNSGDVTAAKLGTGQYRLDFSPAFSPGYPICVASNFGSTYRVEVANLLTTAAYVNTYNSSNALTDGSFLVICVGTRST